MIQKTTYTRNSKDMPDVVSGIFNRISLITEVDYVIAPPRSGFYVQHTRRGLNVWTIRAQDDSTGRRRYDHFYQSQNLESGSLGINMPAEQYTGGKGYAIVKAKGPLVLASETLWLNYELGLAAAAQIGARLVSASWLSRRIPLGTVTPA